MSALDWTEPNWIEVGVTTSDGRILPAIVMSPASATVLQGKSDKDDPFLYLGVRVDMSNYVPNGGES